MTMTGKKGGVSMLVGELSIRIAIFRLIELNIKANPPCFQYVRARAHANDAINYAQ